LLIVVSVIAWAAWHAHSSEQVAEAWENMPGPLLTNNGQLQMISLSVNVPPEYYENKVINGYGGTSAADWAVLYQAEYILLMGNMNAMKGDKKSADQILNDALQRYEKILNKGDNIPWIAERAMFGKARAQEILGQVDEALKSYQNYTAAWPKGAFKQLADQRIDDLQQPDVRRFYDKYNSNDWKPKESPKSEFSKLGGLLPDNPVDDKGTLPSTTAGTGGLMSGSGSLAKPTGGTTTMLSPTSGTAAKLDAAKPADSKSAIPAASASTITAPAIPAPTTTSASGTGASK
jgi:hypothetical protein